MPFSTTRRLLRPLAVALALHAASAPSVVLAQTRDASQGVAPRKDLVARAQQLFDDQQYEESIQTLSAALVRPSNTKAQRVEIYRLLALNYITLGRRDEAESAVRGLLSLEPTYALPTSESPRFRNFFAEVQQRWEAEGQPGLVREEEPPPMPVSMRHTSPSQIERGTEIRLVVRLEDPQRRVVDVKLYFRTGSRGKFTEQTAVLREGAARATIPRDAVKPPLVEYYFEGLDQGGLPVVARGDATAPLRVAVPDGGSGWVLPVAIGGGILGVGAIIGGLALAGVFGGGGTGPGGGGGDTSKVVVTVRE
jgi:tetratricopeptide (TPR) repeat protein